MDKLLDVVKDFPAIKRYLEVINETTDDFLYMLDLPNNRIQVFGNIQDVFKLGRSDSGALTFEEILEIVHPADRSVMREILEKLRLGIIDSHNNNFRMLNLKGETVWVNSRGKVLHDENGAPYVMLGRLSEEALRHLYNPTTGLWNKTKLLEDLETRISVGKGWLMLIGIPTLASLNLIHGRDVESKRLCELADVFAEMDSIEELYHIDSNRLAVIISDCAVEEVESIYTRLCQAMQSKRLVFAGAVPIDSRIFGSISQLWDSAKITLHGAEQNPSSPINFFSPEEITRKISELTLLEEIKESVHNGFKGFEVHYQPQLRGGSYELYGVEALLRYDSPKRGRIFPDEFIPILEQSGLIDPVGMWVLNTALAQCKVWRESIPALRVSVNFSSVQFDDIRLGDRIIEALKKAELPGEALTVELTESIQLDHNKHYCDIIKYIKSYGVHFSIDDFGTGYSNLGYLKQLDVSEIKIDRSFVAAVEKDTYNYRLISNVIEFAKNNSIHACCEGIETANELSVLEPLKADSFQGYLFDMPCTAEQIAKKYIHTSSDEYKARMQAIDEIHRFKEQYGSIHFNPEAILRENEIGLWVIRLDEKNDRFELHIDETMERVLGLTEKLSAEKCYEYWYSRIAPVDKEYVDNSVGMMVNGGKAVQLSYHWIHPESGEVTVRCSGIRTQDVNGMIMLQGYHRTLTGVEGS